MTATPTNGQVRYIVPEGLHHNPAFSNVVAVSGPTTTVYVGGQNAVTADGQIVGKGDIAAQTRQVFANVRTALEAAGATLDDVIKWTLYIVEGQSIQAGFAAAQEVLGDRTKPAPLITAAFVSALAHPDFLLEMDAVAVIPAK